MRRHLMRAGLAITALAAAAGTGWVSGTSVAHAAPGCAGSNDFNGDGRIDVAVGMPGAADGAGAVEVRVSDGEGGTTVHHIDAPQGKAGDQFGTAVAEVARDTGSDAGACSQLLVGAPGRDVDGQDDAGSFFLYAWQDGEFALVKEFSQGADGIPGQAQANARFGTTLASPYHAPKQTGPVVTPLYVGAPGADDGAGGFARMEFTGGADPTATEAQFVTQDTEGVPGRSESGDSFGTSLAVVEGGVLVGAPREDIGDVSNAGVIVQWNEDPDTENVAVSQKTPGVPGHVEKGDHYGTAIYSAQETTAPGGGHYVLVGVPREDIGGVHNAGSAVRFVFDGRLQLDKTKGFNQDSDGVAGSPEPGDLFGSSLGTYGLRFPLVGTPGEDIGDVKDAGAVQALQDNQGWNQSSTGVPGKVEAGDRFGATMGNALYGMGGPGDDGWLGAVLIGTPGENDDRGAVLAGLPNEPDGPGASKGWPPQDGGPGAGYGSAIGKTN